jgi:hypothetical protein
VTAALGTEVVYVEFEPDVEGATVPVTAFWDTGFVVDVEEADFEPEQAVTSARPATNTTLPLRLIGTPLARKHEILQDDNERYAVPRTSECVSGDRNRRPPPLPTGTKASH